MTVKLIRVMGVIRRNGAEQRRNEQNGGIH